MSEPQSLSETIPAALDGERVDRVVSLIADVSRREAVELIAQGLVTVDGQVPEKPSYRVEPSTLIAIEVPGSSDALLPDPEVEIRVVHEDEHVIVVDKVAQQVVHPGSGVIDATMVNGLLARFPEIIDVGEPSRPGIVHRLDRGTSGLLAVARTPEAYESLVSQLAARTVARRYRALVGGQIASNAGLIDAPLGRSPKDATIRAVVAGGREARTRYEVVRRFERADATFVECRLETGRTHQIRAHLAAIDHAVVGDDRYGGPDLGLALARPFLHAIHLGFEHPTTSEELAFDSPLAEDLQAALDRLGQTELDH